MNKPKKGDRVRLVQPIDGESIAGRGARLLPGSEGTVTDVDSAGTVHVYWDEGFHLGLLPEIDKYMVDRYNVIFEKIGWPWRWRLHV